jgi:hypothetical protein
VRMRVSRFVVNQLDHVGGAASSAAEVLYPLHQISWPDVFGRKKTTAPDGENKRGGMFIADLCMNMMPANALSYAAKGLYKNAREASIINSSLSASAPVRPAAHGSLGCITSAESRTAWTDMRR